MVVPLLQICAGIWIFCLLISLSSLNVTGSDASVVLRIKPGKLKGTFDMDLVSVPTYLGLKRYSATLKSSEST